MRIHYLNWFLIFGCSLALNVGEYEYKISQFEVPLDHFAFVSNQTFKIR